MQNFIYYVPIVSLLVSVLVGIIVFFRTGSLKKAINSFFEVNQMYTKKKCQTIEKHVEPKLEFSDYVPDYILNSSTNELEEAPKQKNIQAYIDSFLTTSLQASLEKFLPKVQSVVDDVADSYDKSVQDLALLGETMEVAEEYREKYGLSDNATISDIYSRVDAEAKKLKQGLSALRSSENISDETKKILEENKRLKEMLKDAKEKEVK